MVLSITKDQKIILVKQYRHSVNGYTLEFPAGYVSKGETPVEAAQREFVEETGYICSEIKGLGTGRLMLNRYIPRQYGFLGLGAVQSGEHLIESGMEVVLVNPDTFKKMILSGEFNQMSAIGFWYKAVNLYKFLQI